MDSKLDKAIDELLEAARRREALVHVFAHDLRDPALTGLTHTHAIDKAESLETAKRAALEAAIEEAASNARGNGYAAGLAQERERHD